MAPSRLLVLGRAGLAALLATVAGCTPSWHTRRADAMAEERLETWIDRTLAERRDEVVLPVPATVDEPPALVQTVPPTPAPVRLIGLHEALGIAVRSSRDFLSAQEQLFSQALALVSVGHEFTPQLSLLLRYAFTGGELFTDELAEDVPHTQDAGVEAGVSQILPFGGSLTVTGATGRFKTDDPLAFLPITYDSALSVSVVQPLLRGAGHEVTWEPLIQAERDLVYAIRDFERFREGFSIDVARRFYQLVQQQEGIENQRQNLEVFVFNRRQAEAFYAVGRDTELNVLRARRSELTSQNDLLEAEESYRLALDEFKIFLGLPITAHIDVAADPPDFVPVDVDVASAVAAAFANRLDLKNEQERLEDVERSLRIAENTLLPRLDVTFDYAVSGGPAESFREQDANPDAYTIGAVLEVPVDRVRERNALRQLQLGQAQALRDYDRFRDQLVVEVQSAFRELDRRRKSLDIQRQLIIDQEKNVRVATIQFELGELDNRDVVEAQQALLEARNALINERVSYEIARLELLRSLGILFIDERGMWNT